MKDADVDVQTNAVDVKVDSEDSAAEIVAAYG